MLQQDYGCENDFNLLINIMAKEKNYLAMFE
jgi:hypothetical protein